MNHPNKNIEVENLKKEVFSDDWETVKAAAKRLGEIGGVDVVDFLISLLELDDSSIRNRAALALEQIEDSRAVEPLLKSIFKPENHNYNGTMVFALESLNCKTKLVEIFKILFYETYEAKISAYSILDDQIFEFNRDDLLQVQKMWEECNAEPEKYPGVGWWGNKVDDARNLRRIYGIFKRRK